MDHDSLYGGSQGSMDSSSNESGASRRGRGFTSFFGKNSPRGRSNRNRSSSSVGSGSGSNSTTFPPPEAFFSSKSSTCSGDGSSNSDGGKNLFDSIDDSTRHTDSYRITRNSNSASRYSRPRHNTNVVSVYQDTIAIANDIAIELAPGEDDDDDDDEDGPVAVLIADDKLEKEERTQFNSSSLSYYDSYNNDDENDDQFINEVMEKKNAMRKNHNLKNTKGDWWDGDIRPPMIDHVECTVEIRKKRLFMAVLFSMAAILCSIVLLERHPHKHFTTATAASQQITPVALDNSTNSSSSSSSIEEEHIEQTLAPLPKTKKKHAIVMSRYTYAPSTLTPSTAATTLTPTSQQPSNVPTPIQTTLKPTSKVSLPTDEVLTSIESIQSYFKPISGLDAVSKENSPQNKAIHWIFENNYYKDKGKNLLEAYVLMTLYYSLDGLNWNVEKTLMNPSPSSFCDWNKAGEHKEGVHCEEGKQSISKIMFMGNHVKGTIPTEIFYLSSLKHLSFTYGNIYGVLPSEIGLLSNLSYLNLNYNRITGTLPTEIGNIGSFSRFEAKDGGKCHISMEDNQFTGTIPSEIFTQIGSSLHELNLNHNQLIGSLPLPPLDTNTNATKNLSSLQKLNVAYNRLEGGIMDFDYASLSSLQHLLLNDNQFTGTIPSTISQLPKEKMVSIELQRNMFKGTVPREISKLTKLKKLWFEDNHLTGNVDSFLCNNNIETTMVIRADSCDANGDLNRQLQLSDNTKRGPLITCKCCCCGEFGCD